MSVLIGITCRGSKKRFFLATKYIDAIINSGGTPIIIPYFQNIQQMKVISQKLDGLLLSGGGDIKPKFYKNKQIAKLRKVNILRDKFELELIKYFINFKKPIFGICRGCQIINVAFGGKLIQDVSNHWQKEDDIFAHEITIKKDTLLYKIIKKEKIKVNSYHHQAIKTVGVGLKVSANATDGTIEAIEHPDYKFLLGVQFHPELIYKEVDFKKLFNAFVNACR